jgi:RNA recognition motif-containing protein
VQHLSFWYAVVLRRVAQHMAAVHARCRVGNKPLTITFAEPRRADIAADQQNEIKSVFVGNLPDTATESKLREVFGPLGEITRAFIPAPRDGKTRREFGFVHYVDRASVLQAIKQNDDGDKFVMDGAPLDVSIVLSVLCIFHLTCLSQQWHLMQTCT